MGYTLKIGELIQQTIEDDYGIPYLDNCVKLEKHDHLPKYGEPTDQENQRRPSYSARKDVCDGIGLNIRVFIPEHPGCVKLTEEHRTLINDLYDDYTKKHPNAKPTYGDVEDVIFDSDPNNPVTNQWLVRLERLKYWINRALDNCKQPVFLNT